MSKIISEEGHVFQNAKFLKFLFHSTPFSGKHIINQDLDTATPRNTGRQGTNKFHLLLADFCYCQYRKLKEIIWRDQSLAFIIGGHLGPVLRGLTVSRIWHVKKHFLYIQR